MPSDFTFRLSTYLTLALACICLAFSEWDLLPEVTVVAGLVVVLLGLPFKLKGSWELSLAAANRVGLGIGVVAAGWLAYQFINKNSLIHYLPWPASLLPLLGPLLLVLMLAKMFRPKHVGDWWAMQGIALATVGLAASMAEVPLFGVFLGLYALAAVWSVTTFYFRRTAGALAPVPNTSPGPPPEIVTALGSETRSFTAFRRAFNWLAVAGLVALPLFFLTPRSGVPRWTFAGTALTGLGNEQFVDLNRTGKLENSSELAFEVRVTDVAGRPFDDLSAAQRWRALGYNRYDRGRWTRSDTGFSIPGRARPADVTFEPAELDAMPDGDRENAMLARYAAPDLGPNRLTLDFRQIESGASVVFDPVAWVPNEAAPIWAVHRNTVRSWYHVQDGSFRAGGLGTGRRYYHYRQVAVVPDDPDQSTGFVLAEQPQNSELDPLSPDSAYQEMRVPSLRQHAEALLRKFVEAGKLPPEVLTRADTRFNVRVHQDDFEPVARVFCDYLRRSEEYKYSLTLTRTEKLSDPIEDFVLRGKTGHCQRFASALVLLLRGIGIPSGYVLGHRGCEPQGDGVYHIRQSTAHAWAEVLVPRPRADGPGHRWHWLALDPTPDWSDEGTAATNWWQAAGEKGASLFNDFVMGLNPERQQSVKSTAVELVTQYTGVLLALAVVGAAAAVCVRLRRRGSATPREVKYPTTGVPWYDRMSKLLADAGLVAARGATPWEHARTAGDALRSHAGTAAVAAVPPGVAEAFYQSRFGRQPPTADELEAIHASLDRLEAALRSRAAVPTGSPS